MATLALETRDQINKTATVGPFLFTPPIEEGYWTYRVRLSERQAIVGFPKFLTIGVGFAVEEDWNTNLPYTCDAEEIYAHIEDNKGDDAITREDCLTAIRMIQEAAAEAAQAEQATPPCTGCGGAVDYHPQGWRSHQDPVSGHWREADATCWKAAQAEKGGPVTPFSGADVASTVVNLAIAAWIVGVGLTTHRRAAARTAAAVPPEPNPGEAGS